MLFENKSNDEQNSGSNKIFASTVEANVFFLFNIQTPLYVLKSVELYKKIYRSVQLITLIFPRTKSFGAS